LVAHALASLCGVVIAVAEDKTDYQAELQAAPPGQSDFQPPGMQAIPDDDFGKMVGYGEQLFVDTQGLRGKYVGNDLNCAKMGSPLSCTILNPLWRVHTRSICVQAKTTQEVGKSSRNGFLMTLPVQDI
jgi:hypothetical protein